MICGRLLLSASVLAAERTPATDSPALLLANLRCVGRMTERPAASAEQGTRGVPRAPCKVGKAVFPQLPSMLQTDASQGPLMSDLLRRSCLAFIARKYCVISRPVMTSRQRFFLDSRQSD